MVVWCSRSWPVCNIAMNWKVSFVEVVCDCFKPRSFSVCLALVKLVIGVVQSWPVMELLLPNTTQFIQKPPLQDVHVEYKSQGNVSNQMYWKVCYSIHPSKYKPGGLIWSSVCIMAFSQFPSTMLLQSIIYSSELFSIISASQVLWCYCCYTYIFRPAAGSADLLGVVHTPHCCAIKQSNSVVSVENPSIVNEVDLFLFLLNHYHDYQMKFYSYH